MICFDNLDLIWIIITNLLITNFLLANRQPSLNTYLIYSTYFYKNLITIR